MTRDPLATDPSEWTTVACTPPEFVSNIVDFNASSTALQNPPGQRSDVLSSDLIRIDPLQNYQVEFSVRQCDSTHATAYLAVAWYSQNGQLLRSSDPVPAGAGNPIGWGVGMYSYFGLVDAAVPAAWTTYRKSFGPSEAAEIPPHAKFVRLGALLNYHEAPAAHIQLTDVRLWRKEKLDLLADGVFSNTDRFFIVAPSSQMTWTAASQAGQLSSHWPAQTVAADLAGGAELAAAARAAGAMPVSPGDATFILDANTKLATSRR
jgi:hypothetical protein